MRIFESLDAHLLQIRALRASALRSLTSRYFPRRTNAPKPIAPKTSCSSIFASIDVYVAPMRPYTCPDQLGEGEVATWAPSSSTLISGATEGILIDALLTFENADQIAAWARSFEQPDRERSGADRLGVDREIGRDDVRAKRCHTP